MDIGRQVEYWRAGSDEDLAAAESLLEKGHVRHCLFFAHLAMEKMVKALVAQCTREVPPRIHSLIRLSKLAELKLDQAQADFLREFEAYEIEGRYPDRQQLDVGISLARQELNAAKEMLTWLSRQL